MYRGLKLETRSSASGNGCLAAGVDGSRDSHYCVTCRSDCCKSALLAAVVTCKQERGRIQAVYRTSVDDETNFCVLPERDVRIVPSHKNTFLFLTQNSI